MKLYNLYKEVILEWLITENVGKQQIIDTINGEYANNGRKFIRRVEIHYNGDEVKDANGNITTQGKGWRQIVVHALGTHATSGREVIRAYQGFGDSKRKPREPHGWKLFLVDRITSWKPLNVKHWGPIEIDGQLTNMNGDNSMTGEVLVVNFDEIDVADKNDEIENF